MSFTSSLTSILGGGSKSGTYDLFSYETILKDLRNWKQSGGVHSSEFNDLDMPSNKYFRVMFHFFNGDESDSASTGYGLLHPTWLDVLSDYYNTNGELTSSAYFNQTVRNAGDRESQYETFTKETGDDVGTYEETMSDIWVNPSVNGRAQELAWWNYSTAYSYLMMNNEFERAQYCKEFIELLSNISTYSPWYFQSINGLQEAINRKPFSGDQFAFKERNKITINCLEDAVDNRIATLLDLYRAFTWSWRTKRFIVPANLRKFDMTIAVIEQPIQGIHHPRKELQISDALGEVGEWLSTTDEDFATFDLYDQNHYTTSYKMYEFHNCEIDYNSSQTGVETVDNTTGWQPKFKIDILFDDCEEYSYNEFLAGISEFGDFVKSDSVTIEYTDRNHPEKNTKRYEVSPQDTAGRHQLDSQNELENRLDPSSNVVEQVLGGLFNWTSNKVNSAVMGNLFGFSITRLAEDVQYALSGNVVSVVNGIIQNSTDYNGSRSSNGNPIRNITEDDAAKLNAVESSRNLGNIFESSTIIRTV